MLFQDGNGTNVTNTTSTNVTTPPSPPWWETFELPWWLRLNWEHLPDIHPATFAMVFIFMCGFYFVFLRKRTIPQWGHGALKGGHDYDSKELGRVDRIVAFIESGGQIGDLDEEEEEEFHRRDFSRRSGFRDSGLPTKPATAPVQAGKVNEQALEEREAWVEEHAQAFEEHAQLVGEEEIGSGVVTSDVTAEEAAEYDARVAENGGKQGAVQISLMWDNWNDLDLHVFTPSGERIYFNNRTSACGGELDIDMNRNPTSERAVENIVWTESPPHGIYKVCVHNYRNHRQHETDDATDYKLRVIVGDEAREYEGTLTSEDGLSMITRFTVGPEANGT